MKIGAVSDTHNHEIPPQLWEDFKDVDLIVHAGDVCSRTVLGKFCKIAKVVAVCGNMDDAELRGDLSEKKIIRVEDVAIGICHGRGPSKKVIDFVQEQFKDDKVDVVIFGHSHFPFNEIIDDVLYFNPGSPNDILCAPYCSYGIIEIHKRRVRGKIIKVA